ncbi:hypothetical protein T07_4889, partial [Trichinella nelsoni]
LQRRSSSWRLIPYSRRLRTRVVDPPTAARTRWWCRRRRKLGLTLEAFSLKN